MFAGMAMQRTFANLNKTAREWTGMNEIMSTAMGVVMLPATMDLLEFGVLPLFDALTNLPEPAQKAVGYLSTALEGLGGVMMTGGQLALGIGAFRNELEILASKGITIPGIFSSLGGKIQKVINSGLGRGISITGALMFAASDIFWDEKDNFEWDKKFGAAGLAAMATKGGLAAKAKGGVIVFAVLAAIEIAMDPSGFGATVANIEHYFNTIGDMISDGADWLTKVAKAKLTGADMPDVPKSWSDWKDEYNSGYMRQEVKLFDSGKLNSGQARYLGFSKDESGRSISTAYPSATNEGKTVFAPVYNVNVSDKSEFEKMLQNNTNKLTSDVLRMSRIR